MDANLCLRKTYGVVVECVCAIRGFEPRAYHVYVQLLVKPVHIIPLNSSFAVVLLAASCSYFVHSLRSPSVASIKERRRTSLASISERSFKNNSHGGKVLNGYVWAIIYRHVVNY